MVSWCIEERLSVYLRLLWSATLALRAFSGEPGLEPLRPGGVRRIQVPQVLGYGNMKGYFGGGGGGPSKMQNLLPVPPEGFEWIDAHIKLTTKCRHEAK